MGKRRVRVDGELTARELEVLNLLAQGDTEIEVAQKLRLSKHTVHTHVRKLYAIFGAHNRVQLMNAVRAREKRKKAE